MLKIVFKFNFFLNKLLKTWIVEYYNINYFADLKFKNMLIPTSAWQKENIMLEGKINVG